MSQIDLRLLGQTFIKNMPSFSVAILLYFVSVVHRRTIIADRCFCGLFKRNLNLWLCQFKFLLCNLFKANEKTHNSYKDVANDKWDVTSEKMLTKQELYRLSKVNIHLLFAWCNACGVCVCQKNYVDISNQKHMIHNRILKTCSNQLHSLMKTNEPVMFFCVCSSFLSLSFFSVLFCFPCFIHWNKNNTYNNNNHEK